MPLQTMLLALHDPEALGKAKDNGAKLVERYEDGWLVEVRAEPVGEVTYRLADGAEIRPSRCPRAITYTAGGLLPGSQAVKQWDSAEVPVSPLPSDSAVEATPQPSPLRTGRPREATPPMHPEIDPPPRWPDQE